MVGAAGYESVEALQLLLIPGSAQKDSKRWSDSGAENISAFCPEPGLLRGMIRTISEGEGKDPNYEMYNGKLFPAQWVDFILTTANTWQQPIEDFTLIVERPQPEGAWRFHVSFCLPADGKVEKLDADHFQVHLTNFIQASELHIGFFEVPLAKPAQPTAKK